ncbi:adhesion G protein-coupled receptor F5-like [Alosa pseudoharengus]|uniref:adhesion G protein-coupled receptor F5-like n=1 Tax=Alosa pseudoharengus TaxID=34774 RepID=UPI003F8B6A07
MKHRIAQFLFRSNIRSVVNNDSNTTITKTNITWTKIDTVSTTNNTTNSNGINTANTSINTTINTANTAINTFTTTTTTFWFNNRPVTIVNKDSNTITWTKIDTVSTTNNTTNSNTINTANTSINTTSNAINTANTSINTTINTANTAINTFTTTTTTFWFNKRPVTIVNKDSNTITKTNITWTKIDTVSTTNNTTNSNAINTANTSINTTSNAINTANTSINTTINTANTAINTFTTTTTTFWFNNRPVTIVNKDSNTITKTNITWTKIDTVSTTNNTTNSNAINTANTSINTTSNTINTANTAINTFTTTTTMFWFNNRPVTIVNNDSNTITTTNITWTKIDTIVTNTTNTTTNTAINKTYTGTNTTSNAINTSTTSNRTTIRTNNYTTTRTILNDPRSDKYNRYKTDIETAVEDNSDKIPGYKVNSANVIGFRPGSIIADFSLQLSNPSISFLDASIGIINSLKANSYGFPDNPFAQSERGHLSSSTGSLFPREELVLICNGSITEWRFNGQEIPDASGEVLRITNVNPAHNGRYECVSTKNSVLFIRWENIDSIQPLPNIQTSQDKRFQCKVAQRVTLMCCSSKGYEVEMVKVTDVNNYLQETVSSEDCMYSYIIENCRDGSGSVIFNCKLTQTYLQSFDYSSRSITLTFETEEFDCSDENFGAGNAGQVVEGSCKADEIGSVTAECQGTDWTIIEENCILAVIYELENESLTLTAASLPGFMEKLSTITLGNEGRITSSPANINSVVTILKNVGNISQNFIVTVDIIQNFLNTSSVIVSNSTISAWSRLNNGNTTRNASASLLGSVEDIVGSLQRDTSFETGTDIVQLRQIVVNSSYSETLGADSSAAIFIPEEGNFTITTITFSTLYNVLPVRNSGDNDSSLSNSINAAVVLLQVNDIIKNISFSFDRINETLENPQCVFWNFELFDGLGGWDSFGCELISFVNNTVTCECNHTTSFSVLMSSSIPPGIKLLLDFITYIGVGISLASLIICLIIEGVVWKSMTRNDTSYMRHVSVVNVAVSLLIADIWFIIGAAISDSKSVAVGPCSAATFFIHFFYLAMFFWMLVSALLLFYRTVMVLSQMKRSTMLAIAFSLGYGAPLIIAVVTVAATAGGGGYIRENQICWLNWNETKALLAFVIPALTIVVINLLVMIVVLFKMLKSGVGNTTQNNDRHTLVVLARCVTILTPLFGLTWGFGIGIMVAPEAVGLHVVFALLNSLQGFFILVFGTLLDSKIKSILAGRLQQPSSNSGGTWSTNVGTSASSTLDFFKRIRRRNAYNVSGGMLSPQV